MGSSGGVADELPKETGVNPMKDKQTDTLDLNRRTLLKNATLLIPSALVAGNLAQAEDPAKPTESKKDVGSSKGSETKSEPVAVSPNDLEIDRRLARITAEFGQHLSPEQTKAVRDEVSVNFFRAKRLRAVPLNDFDDPITTFQPFCQELPGKHEIRSESTVIVSKQIILSDDSAFATVEQLAAGLRSGQFTALELAKFYLSRLEKYGPKLNCIATLTPETAIRLAEASDKRFKAGRPLGILDGIPYGAKDLLSAKGYPTSNGCAPYVKRVVDVDCTVIKRLTDAGAVLVSKLAMVECAGGLGYRQANASAFGPGLTPYDTKRWSGGSSSGSGSAVGAGLVPFAIGSETWGSISTPASYCGVTGLRPTYGRVSRYGAFALSYTLDKIGPMARTAQDSIHVLKAIAGADPEDGSTTNLVWTGQNLNPDHRFKLAILKDGVAKAQPAMKANFERALEDFRKIADIVEIDLPPGPFADVLLTILAAESASAFEELVDSGLVRQVTAPEDKIGGYADKTVPAADFVRAQRLRGPMCKAFDKYLAPFDAVLSIPTSQTALPIDRDLSSTFSHKNLGGPGNLCGTPSLIMPTGLDENGLPTAIQIDTRAYGEMVLGKLGMFYQSQTRWHDQRPDFNKI